MTTPSRLRIGLTRNASTQQPKITPAETENKKTSLVPRNASRPLGAQRRLRPSRNPIESNLNIGVDPNIDPFMSMAAARKREGQFPPVDLQTPYGFADEIIEPINPDINSSTPEDIFHTGDNQETAANETVDSGLISVPGPEYWKTSIDKSEKSERSESSSATCDSSQNESSSPVNEISNDMASPAMSSEEPVQQNLLTKQDRYKTFQKTNAAKRNLDLKSGIKKSDANIKVAKLAISTDFMQETESSSSGEASQTTTGISSRRLAQVLPEKKRSSRAANLKKMLSPRSPVTLYQEAQEARAVRKAERETAKIKEAKLQAILENLPNGVSLDEDGNLSGGHVAKQDSQEFPASPSAKVRNLLDFILKSVSVEFKHIVKPLIGGTGSEAANSHVVRLAEGDFYRNKIKFYDNTGMFFSSRDSGEHEKERVFNTTNTLYAFTGSEEATIAMSVLLTQALPTAFHRSLVNSESIRVKGLRMISAMNSKGVTKELKKRDGSIDKIEDIKGLGGMEFHVSKIGANFKVSVNWTCYYEAQLGDEEILPLGENEVIAIHTKAELIVDGEKAAAGELVFEMPDGIERTYEGRLRLH